MLNEILEAVFFNSDAPLSLIELEEMFLNEKLENLTANKAEISQALKEIKQKYESNEFIYELVEIAEAYQLQTKEKYGNPLKILFASQVKRKLSKSALETLSIITYKQPVIKSEIEHIRGVNSDYAVQKLLEKELIEVAGRADLPGRPLLLRTSKLFMENFGLASISELPKLDEVISDEDTFAQQMTPQKENAKYMQADSENEE